MTDPIRVLVVDDQALVRGGFRMLVDAEDDMAAVGEAADGATAVALAREHRPDVVLMDIQMPGVGGVEATRQITADPNLSGTRVLLVTTFDTDEHLTAGLEAGASGFLLKTTEPEPFLRAVRGVAAGYEQLGPGMSRRLLSHSDTRVGDPTGRPDAVVLARLTTREREVVGLVARGLSNAEISAELHVSEATTKTHISRSITKLGARDRAQLVAIAFRSGLARA